MFMVIKMSTARFTCSRAVPEEVESWDFSGLGERRWRVLMRLKVYATE